MRLAKQSQFIPVQNVVYFITLPFLVREIFTFYLMMCYYLNVHFQGQRVKQCKHTGKFGHRKRGLSLLSVRACLRFNENETSTLPTPSLLHGESSCNKITVRNLQFSRLCRNFVKNVSCKLYTEPKISFVHTHPSFNTKDITHTNILLLLLMEIILYFLHLVGFYHIFL